MTKLSALRILRRATVSLVVAMLISYGGARAYLAYETHRAAELLHDLSAVTIGEPEAKALAISQRYDGYEWKSQSKSDFYGADRIYALEVNPWRYGNTLGRETRFHDTARSLMKIVTAKWRRRLGFREWLVDGGIGITNGRVVLVQGVAVTEGKELWLGGSWNLMGEIPADKSRPGMGNYSVGIAHMLWDDEGEAIDSWITPATSSADARDARQLNLACLAPSPGCSELSDLMPRVAERHRAFY
jgi:hypothetical protein